MLVLRPEIEIADVLELASRAEASPEANDQGKALQWLRDVRAFADAPGRCAASARLCGVDGVCAWGLVGCELAWGVAPLCRRV